MTVTVAALKRALEETIALDEAWHTQSLLAIMSSPTTLTILAERLSVCTNEAVAKARAAAERSAMDFPRKDSWT